MTTLPVLLNQDGAALASPPLARRRKVIKKLTGTRSHAAIPTGNPAIIGNPLDR
jgi:hypothetical protein